MVPLLVVEEGAKAVLDIADDVALLELRRLVWSGAREELDPEILTGIYLGQSHVASGFVRSWLFEGRTRTPFLSEARIS